MNCNKAKDAIFRHIDGDADPKGPLTDQERLDLDRHLEVCSGCADFRIDMESSLELLHREGEARVSENFDWKLKLRLSQAAREVHDYPLETPIRGWRWVLRFGLATSVATVLVLFVGVQMIDFEGGSGPSGSLPGVVLEQSSSDTSNATVARREGGVRFPDAEGNPTNVFFDDYTGGFVVNGPGRSLTRPPVPRGTDRLGRPVGSIDLYEADDLQPTP